VNKQRDPPKCCWYPITPLHDVTEQETATRN